MIRAFALEHAHLISIDDTSRDQLNDAIWIDLIDPSDDERSVLKLGLDQTLAEEHELEDLEASARFFEDFFIALMMMVMRILQPSHLPFVMGVYLPCVNVIYLHFVFIECVHVV